MKNKGFSVRAFMQTKRTSEVVEGGGGGGGEGEGGGGGGGREREGEKFPDF